MESIGDTLWTLLSLAIVIGSLIFGTVRKGKKEAQSTPHKEAWPKIDPKEILPNAPRTIPGGPHAPNIEAQAPVRHRAAATSQSPLKKVAKTVQRPSTSTIPPRANTLPSNEPKNGNTEGILEEFDLRKAVIYSEILNPKYKEES